MKPFLLSTFLFLSIALCGIDRETYRNYSLSLSEIIDSLNIEENTLRIVIDKSDYKLSILSDTLVLKEYPVVFGGNPTDNKLMEGDQCTPEGGFKIVSKYPHRNWSKFIWLNYPTKSSWKTHNKAKKDKLIPENAKIGGEIGIHGVPDGMDWLIDVKRNWTLGCISLKNKDVNEIYPYISETTFIYIRK